MILPDHIVDRREFLPVANQSGSQTSDPVSHAGLARGTNGIGIASANPERYTGCAKFSGATSETAPTGAEALTITLPSVNMRVGFFSSPPLSTRPPRVESE